MNCSRQVEDSKLRAQLSESISTTSELERSSAWCSRSTFLRMTGLPGLTPEVGRELVQLGDRQPGLPLARVVSQTNGQLRSRACRRWRAGDRF